MIDISNAKWDLSKEERYAVKWFEENGFSGALEKQYISKTKFTVLRDGVSDTFELVQGIKNIQMKKYMEQYRKSFELKCELESLRLQVSSTEGS